MREREGSEGAPCPSRAVSGSPTFLEEGEDAAAPPQEAGCCLPPPGPGPQVCLDSRRSARHQARRPRPPRSSRRPSGHPFLPGSTRAAEHRVGMTALSSFRVPGDPSAARAPRGHVPCRALRGVLVRVMGPGAAAHAQVACGPRPDPLPRQGRSRRRSLSRTGTTAGVEETSRPVECFYEFS